MEQENDQRTIKQLWDELQDQPKRIIYAKINASGLNDPALDGNILKETERMKDLRAELLLRCGPLLECGVTDKAMESLLIAEGIDPLDAIVGLSLFSAAFAFLAYELERRAIEAQKGDVA
mgnify:FL=1